MRHNDRNGNRNLAQMTEKTTKPSKQDVKKQRLAQALRENLKRRKAQSRDRNHTSLEPDKADKGTD